MAGKRGCQTACVEPLEARRFLSATGAEFHASALPLPVITARQSLAAPVAAIQGLSTQGPAPVAIVRWGDGRTSRVSVSPPVASSDQWLVSAPHAYRRAGNYTAIVSFRERGKTLARVRDRITVVPVGTVQMPAVGSSTSSTGITAYATTGVRFQGVLGTLSFPTPPASTAIFQVRIDWGDGLVSRGQLTALGNDQFQVSGAHTYADPGTDTVKVLASYDWYPLFPIPGEPLPEVAQYPGAYAPLTAAISVSGPPAAIPPPQVRIAGMNLPPAFADSFNGPLATLSGIAPDPYGTDVYAIADWGDGGQAGPFGVYVQYQDGVYVAHGFHTYAGITTGNIQTSISGVFDVRITFKLNDHVDPTQNTTLGSVDDTLTVLPNSQGGVSLNLASGQSFSGFIGSATLDPARTLVAATLDWGDDSGPDTQVMLTPLGNGQFNVSGSHVYQTAGRYRIALQLTYQAVPPGQGYESVQDALVSTAVIS